MNEVTKMKRTMRIHQFDQQVEKPVVLIRTSKSIEEGKSTEEGKFHFKESLFKVVAGITAFSAAAFAFGQIVTYQLVDIYNFSEVARFHEQTFLKATMDFLHQFMIAVACAFGLYILMRVFCSLAFWVFHRSRSLLANDLSFFRFLRRVFEKPIQKVCRYGSKFPSRHFFSLALAVLMLAFALAPQLFDVVKDAHSEFVGGAHSEVVENPKDRSKTATIEIAEPRTTGWLSAHLRALRLAFREKDNARGLFFQLYAITTLFLVGIATTLLMRRKIFGGAILNITIAALSFLAIVQVPLIYGRYLFDIEMPLAAKPEVGEPESVQGMRYLLSRDDESVHFIWLDGDGRSTLGVASVSDLFSTEIEDERQSLRTLMENARKVQRVQGIDPGKSLADDIAPKKDNEKTDNEKTDNEKTDNEKTDNEKNDNEKNDNEK